MRGADLLACDEGHELLEDIVAVVLNLRPKGLLLGAAAGLAVAALVVSDRDVAGLGQLQRDLPEEHPKRWLLGVDDTGIIETEGGGSWVAFDLVDAGGRRDPIGARVEVECVAVVGR